MANETQAQARARAVSHAEYIQTLHTPSTAEIVRITEIQLQKEIDTLRKYNSSEESQAATTIQKAYRGHRIRRELDGHTLDPSERWVALIKELKFRSVTAPIARPDSPRLGVDRRNRAASDIAKLQWQKAAWIAEHASGGDTPSPERERREWLAASPRSGSGSDSKSQEHAYSMLMDMRYFLEMVDQKHRYGANLVAYHEEWLRSDTTNNFFYWLDRGEGRHVSLPICSREKLEKERIRYLSKDERRDYLVEVDDEGKLRWAKNGELITTSVDRYKDSMTGIVPKDATDAPHFTDEAVKRELDEDRHTLQRILKSRGRSSPALSDGSASGGESDLSDIIDNSQEPGGKKKRKRIRVSPAAILNQLLRASVKPGTWIYVSDTVGRLYVGIKSSGAFQHASFLSGGRISSAGLIGIENGQLTYLSPLSGHYRPTTKSFRIFIRSLKSQGVDMSHMRVSGAFEVLLSMEYYRKISKGGKHKKDKEERRKREKDAKANGHSEIGHGPVLTPSELSTMSAADAVDLSWSREHRRGLSRLMDDLNIKRRSGEVGKDFR